MVERLTIPRVAAARESGLVVHVDRVGVGRDGPFVVVGGVKRLLPRELEKWAAFTAGIRFTGRVEFGRHDGLEHTRERGYYARVLETESASPAGRG